MEPREIIEALNDICEKQKFVGDKLKTLSSKTDDLDVVSLISSLSTSAYDLAVDIQESIDTYTDILEEEAEEIAEFADGEDDLIPAE